MCWLIFPRLLTVMDDGLELASGVHTATNLFGSLVITFDGGSVPCKLLPVQAGNTRCADHARRSCRPVFILLAAKDMVGLTGQNKTTGRRTSESPSC
ncbi:MAG: hypothetical protein R2787_12895 [Saprospiraceae bacterium]